MEVLAIIGGVFSGISNLIVAGQNRKAAMTPPWMQASQFQRNDKTYDYIIGGIILVIIGTLIAAVIVSTKK